MKRITKNSTQIHNSNDSQFIREIDNGIGNEGAKMVSEMIKINTTVSELNLRGEELFYEKNEIDFFYK